MGVEAQAAATVIILRDARTCIEAFMVERHHAIDFASGALVFPGGKVDASDRDPLWAELAAGSAASPDRVFFVAAARESFEEAGLLLARREGEAALLSPSEAQRIVHQQRARVLEDAAAFGLMLRAERLTLAGDLMVPFAHWITPETLPKRFDTRFFLIAAPIEQIGAHDGGESVAGFWITPARALQEAEAGRRTLVFPTLMNLRKLARYASVAEAVAATRASPIVTVMPILKRTAKGRSLLIPAEAGYGVSEVELPASR
jgi:8-oxo-dGTP pyrophosphatase MutT (NUDIX family)